MSRPDWMSGRPFVVTADHMTMRWYGYTDGRMFRCHLCGVFFMPGGTVRFVMCNGVQAAIESGAVGGNVLVCASCDGPDIYQKLGLHWRIGKLLYWSLINPEYLPPNPHCPPAAKRR